jgi:hypothetical protein
MCLCLMDDRDRQPFGLKLYILLSVAFSGELLFMFNEQSMKSIPFILNKNRYPRLVSIKLH